MQVCNKNQPQIWQSLLFISRLISYKRCRGKNGSQTEAEYWHKKKAACIKLVTGYSILHKSGPFGRFPVLILIDSFTLKLLQWGLVIFFTEAINKYQNVYPAADTAVWGDVAEAVLRKAEQLEFDSNCSLEGCFFSNFKQYWCYPAHKQSKISASVQIKHREIIIWMHDVKKKKN